MQALGAGLLHGASTSTPKPWRRTWRSCNPRSELAARARLLPTCRRSPTSHLHLHTVLEAAGGLVVAEDDWWGSRAPGADVPVTGAAVAAILCQILDGHADCQSVSC